jgi:hypothetical protein
MDLLTRGAGFGYIGSTITSLIYASFTFIFFALEAAVMAYALELALNIPPSWGYLICALVVIPLVTHGVSVISRLQVWTQPLWLVMLVVPFVYVLLRDPGAFAGITHYMGDKSRNSGFDMHLFGAALTVGIALITQMGEQADYLRFMPARTAATRGRWWFGVLAGGPGWVILGVIKMLGGALLAYLAITHMVPVDRAVDPNQMYLAAYEYVFPNYGWAVAATALFVVISQLKINVTNAYAGSLAWSNFFSRVTHSHPGRVVWVVFNTRHCLHADGDERVPGAGRRAGPVQQHRHRLDHGRGGRPGHQQAAGPEPQGYRVQARLPVRHQPRGRGRHGAGLGAVHHGAPGAVRANGAGLLRGDRHGHRVRHRAADRLGHARALLHRARAGGADAAADGRPRGRVPRQRRLQKCVICERDYEGPDMAHCPAYQGPICSLCCTLDARCGRPLQAARQPVGAMVGRVALAAAQTHLAVPGQRGWAISFC